MTYLVELSMYIDLYSVLGNYNILSNGTPILGFKSELKQRDPFM